MRQKAEAYCRRLALLPEGCHVLCAVSGGIDSMALLHLLWTWSREGRIALTAATFDHQLRPCSGEDAAFVAQWCKSREIPCVSGSGDVAAYASSWGETLEQAARTLRYRFLEQAAEQVQADVIATAHNADDNAETLLLHLLRGSGLNGLGGIPPRRGRIVRPLLEVSRGEIEAYAGQEGIPFREDETNRDTAYTRNYLRHQVMPLLKEKNPGLTAALSRTAESLRQDEACLSQWTEQQALLLLRGNEVSVRQINALPAAVALRLVQIMAQRAKPGVVLPWNQRTAVLALAGSEHPSGCLSLTQGLQARREYDTLLITAEEKYPGSFAPFQLQAGQRHWVPELELEFSCQKTVCPAGEREDGLCLRPGSGTVMVRPRRTGDAIKPPNRGTKTLKKWMIEAKIPKAQRELYPVFELDGQVAAVWNMGRDARWIPAAGEPALEISWTKRKREEKLP